MLYYFSIQKKEKLYFFVKNLLWYTLVGTFTLLIPAKVNQTFLLMTSSFWVPCYRQTCMIYHHLILSQFKKGIWQKSWKNLQDRPVRKNVPEWRTNNFPRSGSFSPMFHGDGQGWGGMREMRDYKSEDKNDATGQVEREKINSKNWYHLSFLWNWAI